MNVLLVYDNNFNGKFIADITENYNFSNKGVDQDETMFKL